MGHFATGVAIVGATDRDGVTCGSTANAITSVPLDPPLLLVCMRRESVTLGVLREAGRVSVSMLDAGRAAIAQRFARTSTPTAGRWRLGTPSSAVPRGPWHEQGAVTVELADGPRPSSVVQP